MPIKIIIAENHGSLRGFLVNLVKEFSPNAEVDVVSGGDDLVKKAYSGNYNIVFTDNNMPPGILGTKAIGYIREFDKEVPIYMVAFEQGFGGHDSLRRELKGLRAELIPKDDVRALTERVRAILYNYQKNQNKSEQLLK